MAINLGELARKLLIKPIVSVGKAIGRDYQNTIYGADWRERAMMRRKFAESRLAESSARIERDREETGYNRMYKQAQAAKLAEETEARALKRKTAEAAAAKAGVPVEEWLAQEAAKDDEIRRALRDAQIEYTRAGTGYRESGTNKNEAWVEQGLPAFIGAANARAAASLHSANRPYSEPGTGGRVRLPNDKYMLLDLALQSGDGKELAKQLRTVSREQLVGTVGETHPLVEAFDKLKAPAAPAQ